MIRNLIKRTFALSAAVLTLLSLFLPVFATTSEDESSTDFTKYSTFNRAKYSDESQYYYKTSGNMHRIIPYEICSQVEKQSKEKYSYSEYDVVDFDLVYYQTSNSIAALEQHVNFRLPRENALFKSVITNAEIGYDEYETVGKDGSLTGYQKTNPDVDIPFYIDHYRTDNTATPAVHTNLRIGITQPTHVNITYVLRNEKTLDECIAYLLDGRTVGKELIPCSKGYYPEDSYIECTVEYVSDDRILIVYHEVTHDLNYYDYVRDGSGNVTGYAIPKKRYGDEVKEKWKAYSIYMPKDFPELFLISYTGLCRAEAKYQNSSVREDKRITELLNLHDSQLKDVVSAMCSAVLEPYIVFASDPYTPEGKLVDVTVDKPAEEDPGEDDGTTIPALIVVGSLGIGAALAGAAVAGGGKGGNQKSSSFKMCINKNFGNQLSKGGKPQAVFARIIEITPDGKEIHRVDLTEQIRVYSSDNSLNVEDGGMSNGYRCAMVRVYDEEEPPTEGKVSFFFAGEGGTFTQNVIFNISVPGIKFFQDNLTLPAGALNEPEFLPFEVSEMGDNYDIEISYSGDEYDLELTEATDPEAKDVHFAVFMEKNKEPIEAGAYVEHWLNVTVRNDKQELKASLKIIRMGLGLNIGAKAINCYRVPKSESAGKAMKDMKPSDFDTSITETQAYLITYDAENHEVIQQPAFPTVKFEPLENEEPEKKKQIKEALERLNIQLQIKNVEDEFANCVIFCKGGYLDAPTRYIVKMTLTYAVGKDTYTKEKNVLLRSQPSRVVAGVKQNYEVDKYDDQLTENLNQIKSVIFDFYFDQLFPLYHMIDRMTYGYNRAYGYDPYQVAKVFDMWDRFQTGELMGIGSDVNQYGVADELEALAAATRSWDGFQGIVLRLSLDIMTGGASEIVMVTLDVNRAAMDYRKETGGKGTALGYFKAMAVPVAFAVLPGAAAKYGKKVTGAVGKAANYIAPNKTAALMNKFEKVKSVANEMVEQMAKDAQKVGSYVTSKIPQGAKNASAKIGKAINEFVENVDKMDPKLVVPKANNATAVIKASVNKGAVAGDAALAEAKLAPKTVRETCIDAAGNAANKKGEIVYNELVAAKKALQANPTSGAAQIRYNQAMVEFKASHAAIEHANSILPGEQLAMRSTLNADLEKSFAEKIEKKFRNKIADKYNVDAATVICDRASAKSDAAVKFGRDIDWTPKVVTKKNGVKYVSQATADELLEQSTREAVEELCGKEYASKFAKKGGFARKLDQTACTIQHKDYFKGGLDTVEQVTNKNRMGEYMGDKARSVADTLNYKGAHPYAEGAKLEKEVMSRLSDNQLRAVQKELEAFAKADAATARTMKLSEDAQKLMEAYALMEEGMYQPAKYGKKIVDKDWVGIKNGYGETLTERDHIINRILDRGAGQVTNAKRATLSEVRYALNKKGTTIGASIENVGDAFNRINSKFGYGTTSQTMGAFGAGGATGAVLNGMGDRNSTKP